MLARWGLRSVIVAGSLMVGTALLTGCQPPPTVVRFSYNGTDGSNGKVQHWTVPAGVTSIAVSAYGAAGADLSSYARGGDGGHVSAQLAVKAGKTLSIFVGGSPSSAARGFNGGGRGSGDGTFGGSGGGASDVRRGAAGLSDRLVVAGGGGGGSQGADSQENVHYFQGGAGGGRSGRDGDALNNPARGGTQSAGGAGGGGNSAGNGSLGKGGNTTADFGTTGGGGGGGYYGGGGGGDCVSQFLCAGSGAGGSGYIVSTAKNPVYETGIRAGHGKVTITY